MLNKKLTLSDQKSEDIRENQSIKKLSKERIIVQKTKESLKKSNIQEELSNYFSSQGKDEKKPSLKRLKFAQDCEEQKVSQKVSISLSKYDEN